MKIRLIVAFALICLVPRGAYSQEVSESRAYVQPNVPDGWTETPFVETAPVPELTQQEQQRGFLLFQRPITEPVYPNTLPLPHERLDSLNVFATPGELEPATLSLFPVRDLKNVTVRCSDLESDAVRLLRFNQPTISKLDVPRVILLPRKSLPIPFEMMGANSIGGQNHVRATLIDAEGKPRAQNIVDAQQSGLLVLDTTLLSPGPYKLKTEILAGDRPIVENTVTVQAVKGIQ